MLGPICRDPFLSMGEVRYMEYRYNGSVHNKDFKFGSGSVHVFYAADVPIMGLLGLANGMAYWLLCSAYHNRKGPNDRRWCGNRYNMHAATRLHT